MSHNIGPLSLVHPENFGLSDNSDVGAMDSEVFRRIGPKDVGRGPPNRGYPVGRRFP